MKTNRSRREQFFDPGHGSGQTRGVVLVNVRVLVDAFDDSTRMSTSAVGRDKSSTFRDMYSLSVPGFQYSP